MSQQELLTDVIRTLRTLGIEFMLSGSHASSLQGEARATHDIDLVASLTLQDVDPLFSAFQGEPLQIDSDRSSPKPPTNHECKTRLSTLARPSGNELSNRISGSFFLTEIRRHWEEQASLCRPRCVRCVPRSTSRELASSS
jgi:hypothetical protein